MLSPLLSPRAKAQLGVLAAFAILIASFTVLIQGAEGLKKTGLAARAAIALPADHSVVFGGHSTDAAR
jgi:hypothetical protein